MSIRTKRKTNTTENEDNVEEIVEIVKAIKFHLEEENCVHGLRYIITEAYKNKNKNKIKNKS